MPQQSMESRKRQGHFSGCSDIGSTSDYARRFRVVIGTFLISESGQVLQATGTLSSQFYSNLRRFLQTGISGGCIDKHPCDTREHGVRRQTDGGDESHL